MTGFSTGALAASPAKNYRRLAVCSVVLWVLAGVIVLLGQLLPELYLSMPSAAGHDFVLAAQLGVLAVALGLLLWVLRVSLPRLRAQSAAMQQSYAGLQQIMLSIDQGVFVLDSAACFDTRVSASVSGLLGREIKTGDCFLRLLNSLQPPDQLELSQLYLRLQLAGRVKEKLMRGLNPLSELPVKGARGLRYLSFEFRRLQEVGEALKLLVTVSDVSAQVEQKKSLETARQLADGQWNAMLRMVQLDPVSLLQFIDESMVGLMEVNERLKATSGRVSEYRSVLSHSFRVAHSLKSAAMALKLDFLAEEAGRFEDLLDRMRGEDSYGADDLVAMGKATQTLFEQLGWLRKLATRQMEVPLAAPAPGEAEKAPEATDFTASLVDLAQRVASDRRKQVLPGVHLAALQSLPASAASALRLIATQFVRNALAHGIETPVERVAAGKPEMGQLVVQLEALAEGRWALRVRDDGQGLCAQRLRAAMLAQSYKSAAELEAMSEQQVVMEIFKRGFSTVDVVDAHAGRGVGLDVVSHAVRRLGGRVRLQSEVGKFTEFRVEFSA